MRSFVTAVDLGADSVRALPVLRFVEKEETDAVLLFGNVTGAVLTDAERVLYNHACQLLAEEPSLFEKVRAAQAFLSRPGIADHYREALQFYLGHIVDLSPQEQLVWKEAHGRASRRLREFSERVSAYPYAVLADTGIAEEVFEDRLLDYDSLPFGEARTLKAVGLSPRDGILLLAEGVPEEYRQELRRAAPLAGYLAEFDLLLANSMSKDLQAILERAANRLVILPGERPDVADLENVTLAFESPETFSHYEFQGDRLVRFVHRPVAGTLRLVRQDTFDPDFKLLRTRTDFERTGLVSVAGRARKHAPEGGKRRRALAEILSEAKEQKGAQSASRQRRPGAFPSGSGGWQRLRQVLTAPVTLEGIRRLGKGRVRRPELADLPVSKIRDNPDPLREHLDEGEMASLAQSIREFGVIVPIIVRATSDGGHEVVAGQRRLTAARLAGLVNVPAIVKRMDDRESAEVCYLENLHRVDLKPVEDAEAFERLAWELRDYTKQQLIKRLGLDPQELKVHDEILQMPVLLREAMSMGLVDIARARLLATVRNDDMQVALLRRTIRHRLSVEALGQEVRAAAAASAQPSPGETA